MPDDSDPQLKNLFGRLKEGDDTVLALLWPMLYPFCEKRVGNGSAQDVVQETLMKISNMRERIDLNRSPKCLMFKIATNSCKDELRRRDRRPEEPLEDLGRGEPACSPAELTSYQILDVLDADLREAFVLVKLEGFSLEEVGKMVGCDHSTVHRRVKKACTIVRLHFPEGKNR
jgi:RNA polymerase sigma-70 factor (ECF subfamily)